MTRGCIQPIGVVGAGAMGTGITQIAAQAGIQVRLLDRDQGVAEAALARLAETLGRLESRGKIEADAARAATAMVRPIREEAEFGDCALVIEVITESLAAKMQLFARLEDIVADDCILATNTSSLSVTAIASACRRPERVAGFHFFNPVPLMRVVEVIGGVRTGPAVIEALMALAERLGHHAVVAQDAPGFIVNHAGRAFSTEALRLAEENVASFAEIDRILREAAGFRMGPFELFDLTGLDVSHPATEAISAQFYGDPRYRPSYLTHRRMTAGKLGRKTGAGFYEAGAADPSLAENVIQDTADCPKVWIVPEPDVDQDAVRKLLERLGATVENSDNPSDDALILLTPLGEDATTASLRSGVDARRAIAIDTLTSLDRHRSLMATPATAASIAKAARALLERDGVGATIIRDSCGFVVQRTLAMIVNLACEIAQQGIGTPRDIDDAVRLGLGYPLGPLSWGNELGSARILKILETIHQLSGDPRYRPSGWLRRRARLGLSLLHQEQGAGCWAH